MPRERSAAFAPGRVNLIGEHTDYNEGLALPFAIAEGVTVRAQARPRRRAATRSCEACAGDLDERDEFPLGDPPPAEGWRAFVRGVVAELARAGLRRSSARACEISGDVPRGAGLSSSAALEVALCLALLDLAADEPRRADRPHAARAAVLARGERVGRRAHRAARPARLAVRRAASGAVHRLPHARDRARCRCGWTAGGSPCSTPASATRTRAPATTSAARSARAPASCSASRSLRDAERRAARRAARAAAQPRRATCSARTSACARPSPRCAPTTCRRSARCSTPRTRACATSTRSARRRVEAAVERMRSAGAAGARLIGGGFGGSVLGLFAPGVAPARRRARGAPRRRARTCSLERLTCRRRSRYRRAATSAHAVSTIASDSAASAPSSGASSSAQRELLVLPSVARAHAADRARAPAQLARRRAQAPLGDAHRQCSPRRSAAPGARPSRALTK